MGSGDWYIFANLEVVPSKEREIMRKARENYWTRTWIGGERWANTALRSVNRHCSKGRKSGVWDWISSADCLPFSGKQAIRLGVEGETRWEGTRRGFEDRAESLMRYFGTLAFRFCLEIYVWILRFVIWDHLDKFKLKREFFTPAKIKNCLIKSFRSMNICGFECIWSGSKNMLFSACPGWWEGMNELLILTYIYLRYQEVKVTFS